jgi:hypothetical protein
MRKGLCLVYCLMFPEFPIKQAIAKAFHYYIVIQLYITCERNTLQITLCILCVRVIVFENLAVRTV